MSIHARNKDSSHDAVVKAFKALGCDVLVINLGSDDAWDLVVGFAGKDHGVEVKPPEFEQLHPSFKPHRTRKDRRELRPSQVKFHEKWRGARPQVARTPDDVVALVLSWRNTQLLEHQAAQALARERAA